MQGPLNVKYANWIGINLRSLVQSKKRFEGGGAGRTYSGMAS